MTFNSQQNISDKLAAICNSDVLQSYISVDSLIETKNIQSGSFTYTTDFCREMQLSQLTSGVGTINTKLRLSPSKRNALCAQSGCYIDWEIEIPEDTYYLQLCRIFNDATKTTFAPSALNAVAVNFDGAEANLARDGAGYSAGYFRAWIGYPTSSQIASSIGLQINGGNEFYNTGNFNYLQALISANSLNDNITSKSTSTTNLQSVVETNLPGAGKIVEIKIHDIAQSANSYFGLPKLIIGATIDLNQANSVINCLPIITRNMEIDITLQMENFLTCLSVSYLNKINYTTGKIAPYSMIPIDKCDKIYLPSSLAANASFRYSPYLARITRHAANVPVTPCRTIQNAKFNRLCIVKTEFNIEQYDEVLSMMKESGRLEVPIKLFRSTNFQQRNSTITSQLEASLSASCINKIFVTLPRVPQYPAWLPPLTLTQIQPMFRHELMLPHADRGIGKSTIYRTGNALMDLDNQSMSHALYHSLTIPNMGKDESIDDDFYGKGSTGQELNACIFLHTLYEQSTTPTFLPNQAFLGFDCNLDDAFRRGWNSPLENDYNPNSSFILRAKDVQEAGVRNITCVNANQTTIDQHVFANFIANPMYGRPCSSEAVGSVHCLCDSILVFKFDQYGRLIGANISDSVMT